MKVNKSGGGGDTIKKNNAEGEGPEKKQLERTVLPKTEIQI